MSADTPAVICRGILKSYAAGGTTTPALRGINLSVSRGELCMLVGPSGCGKTTLISIIAGILNQDAGSCEVLGIDIKALSEHSRTKFRGSKIGFVFQSYNLIPSLNVVENVSVPLLIHGVARTKAAERARSVLAQVGLEDKFAARPAQLSGGQQQRVAIARSLVHDPELIVCDEPTAALDHDNGQRIMALFRSVALSTQRTLIIVTHDNRIFKYADRIARMDDGMVVSIGGPEELEQPPSPELNEVPAL